jgi:uncharacterized protein (TIGR02246 family)
MTKLVVTVLCLVLLSFIPSFAQQSAPTATPVAKTSAAPALKAKAKPVNDEAGIENREAEIKNRFDEFSQAWAAGDAKKMASFWVKDGSLINPFGQDAWNREDVEKILIADTQLMKGSTQTFDDFKFRFILTGFALVDCSATLAGMKNADGTDVPGKSFHIYAALALRDNQWYILALRPYAFAPMPGSTEAAASTSPASSMDATSTPAVSPAGTPSATPTVKK